MWGARAWCVAGMAVAVGAAFAIAVVADRSNRVPVEIGPSAPGTATGTDTSRATDLRLGESVKLGDPGAGIEVTVDDFRVGESQVTDSDLPAGATMASIKVTARNITKEGDWLLTEKGLAYLHGGFTLYDTEGIEIKPVFWGPETALKPKAAKRFRLRPGQSTTGWIDFPIPGDATPDVVLLTTTTYEIGTWKVAG